MVRKEREKKNKKNSIYTYTYIYESVCKVNEYKIRYLAILPSVLEAAEIAAAVYGWKRETKSRFRLRFRFHPNCLLSLGLSSRSRRTCSTHLDASLSPSPSACASPSHFYFLYLHLCCLILSTYLSYLSLYPFLFRFHRLSHWLSGYFPLQMMSYFLLTTRYCYHSLLLFSLFPTQRCRQLRL